MYQGKSIGVVVASHNEEIFIRGVVDTMPAFVDRIYVTNDGSSDGTAAVLAGMRDARLTVITHNRRMGVGAATISGYQKACADAMDIIAVINGDGQMDPAILDKIIDPVVRGVADYSKGDRLSTSRQRRGMPPHRLFANAVSTYVVRVATGYWGLVDPLNGYTAVTRDALEMIDLDKVEKGYTFETDLLVKLNVIDATVVNVRMNAKYGNEKSKVQYLRFTIRLAWVILRDSLWRIWAKHISRQQKISRRQTVIV